MPELRRDPVVGRWVIISTERARRPSDFAPRLAPAQGRALRVLRGAGGARRPTRSGRCDRAAGEPNTPGWLLRVVPNKFPALRIEGELEPSGEGLYDRMNGVGAHEVVIESPEHEAVIEQLPGLPSGRGVPRLPRPDRGSLQGPPARVRAWCSRTTATWPGASLEHTHSQLDRHPGGAPDGGGGAAPGRCSTSGSRSGASGATSSARSGRTGGRLIADQGGFVALAPFAPRFPFETWILPTAHRVPVRGDPGGGVRGAGRGGQAGARAHERSSSTTLRTTSCSTARRSGRRPWTTSTGTSRSSRS